MRRRRLTVILSVLLAVGGGVVSAGSAIAAPPVPAAAASAPAPTPTASARSGRSAEVTVTLAGTGVSVRVAPLVAVPDAELRVTISTGDVVLDVRRQSLTDLRAGVPVTAVVPLPALPAADTGVSVTLLADGTEVGGDFVAVRRVAGEPVTAPTLAQLPEAVLAADLKAGRIGATAYRAAVDRAHLAPGYDAARTRVLPPAAGSAATTTVSGRATYTFRDGSVRAVREGQLTLVDTAGTTYVSGRTDSAGYFSLATTGLDAPASVAVRLTADNPAGSVRTASSTPFTTMSGYRTLSAGQSWTGVAVALTTFTETNNAFAVLDAVRTAGGYYQRIRSADWDAKIGVIYPSGDDRSFADRVTHLIRISGGETRCGTGWCTEDAFDWDVLAHETGHVVAFQAGIHASPGGIHYVCNNGWTGGTSKTDAVRLAWSEGWATFWGLAALQEEGVPQIPDAGGAIYDDHLGPPHGATDNDFSYPMEGRRNPDDCMPHGEDSEIAVGRVLWDLYDTAADGESVSWSPTDILGRVRAAGAVTFTTAYAALIAGRSVADRESAQAALTAQGMAPRILTPTSAVTGTCPPRITWEAGGPPGHLNTAFTVRATVGSSRTVAFQKAVGNVLAYTPTLAEWQAATRTGSLYLEIAGSEPTAPGSGPFWSRVQPLTATASPSLMVVGDSISHGMENDYTWRYRLAQHLSGGCAADFVGPWSGTNVLPASQPDDFPTNSAPPVYTGQYRSGLSFDSQHWSRWGRQLTQAKSEIRGVVTSQRPTHLLIELGFNDLGWGASDPDGLIASMRTFVAEARAARPDVKLLVANVVGRTPLESNPGLPAMISSYNAKLGPALAALSTSTSPVALVDIHSPYVPTADTYDGLHPNGRGEYKIAKAFADVLSSRFGIGTAFGSIPASVPDAVPPRPASITATATDAGITIRWGHSVGAGGYWLYQRNVTAGESFSRSGIQIPADSWKINWVVRGHTYEFKVVAARGDNLLSAESAVASAVANPTTADGPTGVLAYPSGTAIQLAWTRPTTNYSSTINGYRVYYVDETVGGGAQSASTSGTTLTLTGLVSGHRYNVAIASINAAGEGLPSGAPPSITGVGTPAASTMLSAYLVDGATVDLTWRAVPGAAGYWIDHRIVRAGEPLHRLPVEVNGTTERVTWLFGGAETYEFCVVAANGSYLGPRSNCLRSSIRPPNAVPPAGGLDSRTLASAARPADLRPLERALWRALEPYRTEGARRADPVR